MALHTDIVARLDERSSRTEADKLVQQFASAGTRAGAAFAAQVQSSAEAFNRVGGQLATQFTAHGRLAGRNFGTGFGAEMVRSLPGISGFASTMSGYEGAAAKSGALAGRALGMAFTTAAGGLIGAAGYTLFKGFQRYEAIDAAKNRLQNLNRTLQATGKAGIDVQRVMDTVNKVVLDTPFALDKAFSVATRALASNTGDLKRFMTDVADAAGFAGAGIDEIGDAFLQVANQGKLSMEEVTNQLRNIPVVPWLQETMHLSGAELAKMLRENKVGLEDLLKAIEQHAGGFAKASGDTIQGAIQNVQTSIARGGANFLGALFGKPTDQGNTLVEVLKTLRQRLDEMSAWVTAHQREIHDFFKNSAEVAGEVVKVLGAIARALAEHKELIYVVAGSYAAWKTIEGVSALITSLQTINTLLGVSLPASATAGATAISAALSAIALPAELIALLPLLKGSEAPGSIGPGAGDRQAKLDAGKKYFDQHHQMPQGYQQWLEGRGPIPKELEPLYRAPSSVPFFDSQGRPLKADGTPFGPTAPGPYDPRIPKSVAGDGGPGPAGGPILPPSGAAGDGKPHLPKAPVVPYDTTLPPGFENLPMSSSLYGAESSFLDARHKLAEKRARLAQLEHDANATEQDVLDARNDVVEALRDQQQSELRLYEARAEIFGKQGKQFKSWLSELGDIGAALDQDFGISKGLAGIAENITKFIANLAAAPLLGRLAASQLVSGYKPGEAGSGLMGAMAASGAFGSQYQLTPFASLGQGGQGAPGAALYYPASRGGGAYPGDAALLASVPAGRYDASGDLSRGLGDCSSAVEDLVNILDGRPTAGRSMATGNAAQWLTQHGFIPGMGGPGDFRVGFNGGHMQATLPGGTPFNWGSDAAAANRGIGGTGADDPALTSHYFRPGGASPSGGPGLSIPGLSMPGPSSGPASTGPAARGPAGGGGRGGAVGPGTATQWRTNADGSKTGLDASGNATGDYIPPGAPSVSPSGFGPGGGVPRAPSGPQPGAPGPGLPQLPYTANPTRIGGVAAPQGKGSGGAGIGGMAMAAIQAGIGAAGMAGAPFGGQAGAAAAQAMIQLVNRGIQFGSQAAGIGVQGLAETLLPAGSDLATNNWVTKIAGGLAGASLALPNVAGKGGEDGGGGPTPEQVVGQGQGIDGRPAGLPDPVHQGGNTDNSKNVNITNNNTFNAANWSENSMANTVAAAQLASYTR
ncbi:tape measure protein [Mycobacterium gordonae]|uniref:Tape measure protein N-terminal domain-containing protein n=1 Tax=Mycobacterium gordonae TaxID=1778 RepID=A0A1X1X8Q9_MYCGO|nr:tape measure protein [Mycobacterium gordonae]MCV7005653.1 tape measure protein [Mycobacterium gordonae]ODR23509.1 hypothetical protein BHQ23_04610 [Mycobacterium gordonae]ORV95219.1 hypothetical protein AWC08_15320 [Mycobacterium gordonae]